HVCVRRTLIFMVGRAEGERRTIDAEVVRLIGEGKLAEAATFALESYGVRILGYLGVLLRDEEAAREVYAQFTENLWRGIGGFRGECVFRTWAYQLAHNAARQYAKDAFRRRGRRLVTGELQP